MKHTVGIMAALVCLSACDKQPDMASTTFPPVGLAATARWLEAENGLSQAAQTGATQAIATQTQLNQPGAAQPAAVFVPDRTRPTSTAGRAAQAFADICVASLPDMRGVVERLRQVNQRDFGRAPEQKGGRSGTLYIAGEARGDIYINLVLNAGASNANRCVVNVRGQNHSTAAQAMIDSVAATGFALSPTSASDAQRAWLIAGAPSGTLLKMNSRRNALGQQLTGVWITWP